MATEAENSTVSFVPHPLSDQPSILQWEPPVVKRVLELPSGDEGRRLLARQGCWRGLLDNLKTSPGTTVEDSLRATTFKVLALCKLRQYSAAFDELNALGGLDSSQYTQEGSKGPVSLVPFILRWLNAQLPGLLGKLSYAIEELYKLKDYCNKRAVAAQQEHAQAQSTSADGNVACKNSDATSTPADDINVPPAESTPEGEAAVEVSLTSEGDPPCAAASSGDSSSSSLLDKWISRERLVTITLINYHLRTKDYVPALLLCNDLLKEDDSNYLLWSRVGYIQLLMGDVVGAAGTFDRVHDIMAGRGVAGDTVDGRILRHLNTALVLFGSNDFAGCIREYDALLELSPNNTLAVNNKCVAYMYSCKLQAAINAMEQGFVNAPIQNLQEPFVLNLSSMYELNAAPHRDDARHKITLWASRCGPEDFDAACLRVA